MSILLRTSTTGVEEDVLDEALENPAVSPGLWRLIQEFVKLAYLATNKS